MAQRSGSRARSQISSSWLSDGTLTCSAGRGRRDSETKLRTPEISDSGSSPAWHLAQVVICGLNIKFANGALGSS